MGDGRKKAVSLRLGSADLRRIKHISERLGVRDSDLIRYAIKALLSRLSPLSDPELTGRSLVPLFLDGGADLVHQFDLDVGRLGAVINDGAAPGQQVSQEDLHLIAMTAAHAAPLLVAGVSSLRPQIAPSTDGGPADRRVNPTRRYLYDKYLYQSEAQSAPPIREN